MPRIVAALALLFLALPASAKDPIRRLPRQCGFVFQIENPRQFVESVTKIDAYQGLQSFPPVQEYLDSTQVRRFFQVVKYLEGELGGSWPTLLDKVAGRGIALGVALAPEPQPGLLVIEGTDAATVAKAHALFLTAVREENGRAEVKQEIESTEFEGVAITRVGKDFCTAVKGTTIYLANKDVAMRESLKLAAGKTKESAADHASLAAARDQAVAAVEGLLRHGEEGHRPDGPVRQHGGRRPAGRLRLLRGRAIADRVFRGRPLAGEAGRPRPGHGPARPHARRARFAAAPATARRDLQPELLP
jgi:hypothetical protein